MKTLEGNEVHLTQEETARLKANFVEATHLKEEQLELIFVCSPCFLQEHVLLCKFRAHLDNDDSIDVYDLLFRIEEGFESSVLDNLIWGTWSERTERLLKRYREKPPFLQIDADNVLEYVRFYLGIANGLNGWVLLEEPNDICWCTPLLPEEMDSLGTVLRADDHRLRVIDENDQRFEIGACVLDEDQLKYVTFFVDKVSVIYKFGTTTSAKLTAGRLDYDDDHAQVLLSGLPDNYVIDADHWSSSGEAASTRSPYDWFEISKYAEKYTIIQDINRYLTPVLAPSDCTLRRKYLPIYGQHLYEITVPFDNTQQTLLVVWSPGKVKVLSCDTKSILELNETFAGQMHSALANEEIVKEYVRFITYYWWTDDGPSLVVEDRNGPRFADVDLDAMETPDDTSAEEAWSRIVPVTVTKDGDAYFTDFCFWQGYAVFLIRLRIKTDGDWEAIKEQKIMSFPAPEGHSLIPYQRLAASHNAFSWKRQQVNRETLTVCTAQSLAEEIKDTNASGKITIEDRIIIGSLDLEGIDLSGKLIIRNCRFRGPVNLSSLTCPSGINITSCVFERALNLEHATIVQALEISDTVFISGKNHACSLILNGLNVQILKISRVNCQKGFTAISGRISGYVEISEFVSYGLVNMEDSVIDGNLYLSSGLTPFYVIKTVYLEFVKANRVFIRGVAIGGSFKMDHALVDQYVVFDHGPHEDNQCPVRIGHAGNIDGTGISLYSAVIKHGYISFKDIDIAGDVNACFVRTGTGIIVETPKDAKSENRIDGSLVLAGAKATENIRIMGCRISGNLNAYGVKASAISVRSTYMSDSEDGIQVLPVSIGGFMDFTGAHVGGDAWFAGIETNTRKSDTTHSIVLRRATIEGNLEFQLGAEKLRLFEDHIDSEQITGRFLARLPRGINLRKITVNGDLDLSHVDAGSGAIDLRDAAIGRDVVIARHENEEPATSLKLNLEGILCSGNIDVTGLELHKPDNPDEQRSDISDQGSIIARGATVDDSFEVYKDGFSAVIPGKLDLNSSKLGELAISYHHFNRAGCEDEKDLDKGILLNRAAVGKLSVTVDGGFPCPIDLGFSEIEWWEFRRAGGASCDNAGDYIQLLGKDPNPQRHTWRAVENSLYERGYEEAADSVHKAMREWVRDKMWEETRESPWWLRAIWTPVRLGARLPLDALTEYGTSVYRLGIAMFFWFLLSTYMFSISSNIVPSEEGLAATNTELTSADHPPAWGLLDGLWMATRFHVPVVLFTARDEWEPSNGEDVVIYVDAGARKFRVPHINPEGYANVVIALHWIAWPIILITMSRKLFRRSSAK